MADMPKSANSYAYVPDPKLSSTWKLPIDTPEHIAGAITALTSGFRGNKVEIPGKDKSKVVSRIRGAINKLSDKDQKKNLLERLATVKDIEKAFTGKLEPEDVNYIPLSTTKGEACANCRWFMAGAYPSNACFIVDASDPDDEPILPTGYCDRWEANPAPAPEPIAELAEALVEAVGEVNTSVNNLPAIAMPMVDIGKALEEPGVLERIWKGIQGIITPSKEKSDLLIFKGDDGKTYWLATFTNNFKDLEGEIITERAHKDYEMRLDMKLTPMPELWAWHTQGTKHGQADMVWYEDHNQHALGHFDDSVEAEKAIAFYRKNPVKLSHGFIAPEWGFKDGVYSAYNTFEISTLPPFAAANPYTSFEEIKSMPVPEKREEYFKKLFGDKAPDVLAKVNARNDQSKELATMTEYKDFASPSADENKDKPADENTKVLSELFSENVEFVTELINLAKTQSKDLKDKGAEIAALKTDNQSKLDAMQKQLDDLGKLVNAPPRRPSQDGSTLVPKDSPLNKDVTPKAPDTFFGDLYKTAPNGAKQ